MPWLQRLMRAHPDAPRYGTPQWDTLPPGHPAALAGLVRAAEAWRDHCSAERVAEDLLAEMRIADLEVARRVREASWDVARHMHPRRTP